MGRPANHYRDKAGREIHGLALRSDGRFYAIKARGKTFGKDPLQAVRKFRQWEQEGAKASLTERHKSADGIGPNLIALEKLATGEVRNIHGLNSDAPYSIHHLPQNLIWEYVAAELEQRPKWVADQVGREEIGYLAELEPPPPSIKLDQVAAIYQQKKNCGDKEKRQGLTNWTEFVRIMRKVDSVKTIRDIKLVHVEYFHEWLHGRIDKGKYSPKYANMKMGKVRTMLRYALKRSADKQEIRRVIDLTELFESARNVNGQVKAITVEDYHKILKACRQVKSVDGDLWYALILFSLNICGTGSDLQQCMNSHVDLSKRTLVYPRPKNGIMRVGVLWARTVKAIKAYQDKHNHGLDVVFANWDCRKKRYSPLHAATTIHRQFRKIANQAGLKVDLKMIRKGGYSAAIEGGCDPTHAEILMGHAVKISNVSDHYLERNPNMVADACKAIENHYFGERK